MDLNWTVVTLQTEPIFENDVVNPTHASLYGLIGSMAKEYPNWKIRLVDLEVNGSWPMDTILNMPANPQGNPLVYRGGEWYRQRLVSYRYPSQRQTLYRTAGVYVVIGGAGGIGEAWSEYMIRTYQAKVIWIGRRPKDATIQAKVDRLTGLGSAPTYINADAGDRQALQQAYDEIKRCYPWIARNSSFGHRFIGPKFRKYG